MEAGRSLSLDSEVRADKGKSRPRNLCPRSEARAAGIAVNAGDPGNLVIVTICYPADPDGRASPAAPSDIKLLTV